MDFRNDHHFLLKIRATFPGARRRTFSPLPFLADNTRSVACPSCKMLPETPDQAENASLHDMANEQNAPARFGPPDATLDPARGIALYVQLANLFRYQILSGAWPANHRLEKFETLAAQFKVARITVRQAVALLVQEGLLTTHRGRGTIVCDLTPTTTTPRRQVQGARAESAEDMQLSVVYKNKVKELPEELRADFVPFESYIEISKVHSLRGVPFGMMRIFVADEIFKQFPRRALEKSTVVSLVFEHAPELSANVRQVMSVEVADYIISEHLDYPFGSPIAKIVRHVYGDDKRLAYVGVSWYRGDSFEMELTLPRELVQGTPLRRSRMAPRLRSSGIE